MNIIGYAVYAENLFLSGTEVQAHWAVERGEWVNYVWQLVQ